MLKVKMNKMLKNNIVVVLTILFVSCIFNLYHTSRCGNMTGSRFAGWLTRTRKRARTAVNNEQGNINAQLDELARETVEEERENTERMNRTARNVDNTYPLRSILKREPKPEPDEYVNNISKRVRFKVKRNKRAAAAGRLFLDDDNELSPLQPQPQYYEGPELWLI